jgi:predicted DNA-binding protein
MGNAHDKRLPGYPVNQPKPTTWHSLKPPPSGCIGAPFDAWRIGAPALPVAACHEKLYSSVLTTTEHRSALMPITTDDGDVIKAADHAAAIVEGRGKTEYVGTTKLITIRIPMPLAVQLQAMAQKSGKSRNATIATLLEVGLEEVRERLDETTLDDLQTIEQELFTDELHQMAEG